MATAILAIMGIALCLFTLPILAGWAVNLFGLEPVITMLVMDLAVWGGWWFARRGLWRWASFVPPAVFFVLPLYGVYTASAPMVVGLLFLSIAILLTGMLQGIRSQWYMVAICIATYAAVEWVWGTNGVEGFSASVIMVSGAFVGIALLQWFFTSLLHHALAQTKTYAHELQTHREDLEYLFARGREQARHVQQIIDTVPEGVLLLDQDHRVILANPAGQQNLAALAGSRAGSVLTALGEHPLIELLEQPEDGEWHEVKAEGCTFEVIARPIPIIPASQGWVMVIRDMTHERDMHQLMRHQERMASLGQLTGGIAHDFNNLLTAIQGYTQFAIDELGPGSPIRADLEEVEKAAKRAAALTSQLLAFSRKQILQPEVLDLNDLIREIKQILQRMIGEHIELLTVLSPTLGRVKADPTQMEQVILNLAINARDAMPDGGQLTIETANIELDSAWAREQIGGQPGEYVMLVITDTGTGIDDTIRKHIFEPFFTTKEVGKGTGLGLATVHGIVTQSGGYISVDSTPGEGASFRVYLPRAADEEPAMSQTASHTLDGGGQVPAP
jgi:signal transduction histidine kinase